jgi:hypothetical protein
VAVGRGFRRGADTGDLAATRPILDHDRLAEALLERLGDQARKLVGLAAGGHRHDDRDLTRRVVGRALREDACGGPRGQQHRQR